MVKGKSTKGRQKIEMKRIESVEARQVCFSKRRASLFKKASELSTLCGAEVAVVAFSPGGKCFSFGHPSTISVTDRFLATHTLHGHTMGSGSNGSRGLTGRSHEMNQQLLKLQQSIEDEKRRKERAIEAMERESGGPAMQLLNAEVGALGIDELEELRKDLSTVQSMVKEKAYKILLDATLTRSLQPQSHMNITLASQVLFGGRSTTSPSSSN